MTKMVTCPGDLSISVNSRKFSFYVCVEHSSLVALRATFQAGETDSRVSRVFSALCGQASLRAVASPGPFLGHFSATVTPCAACTGRGFSQRLTWHCRRRVWPGSAPFASASSLPGSDDKHLGFHFVFVHGVAARGKPTGLFLSRWKCGSLGLQIRRWSLGSMGASGSGAE